MCKEICVDCGKSFYTDNCVSQCNSCWEKEQEFFRSQMSEAEKKEQDEQKEALQRRNARYGISDNWDKSEYHPGGAEAEIEEFDEEFDEGEFIEDPPYDDVY